MEVNLTIKLSSGKEIVLTKSEYAELVDHLSLVGKERIETRNVNNWD